MKSGKLNEPYIAIMKDGKLSYGGNQEWWKGRSMSGYGCGTIAATDILLYLDLHKDYCKGKEFQEEEKGNGILDAEVYEKCVETMRKKYFPIIPGLGIPGWLLGIEVNRYFIKNRIPLKAAFGVRSRNIPNRIKAMLAHDIPVILAIGPNFPIPLRKHKLAFYNKTEEGYEKIAETAAHFVVVTGFESEWLRISSWGREYYINFYEYQNYVKKHSCSSVSNICYIKKKKRK